MFVCSKLFSPLNYWRIYHKEKVIFDIVLPVVCAASFLILNYTIFPHKISILGSKGIVDLINGILQILSGFYIASLAAIATASLPRLDEPMKGATPLYIGKKTKNSNSSGVLNPSVWLLIFHELACLFYWRNC